MRGIWIFIENCEKIEHRHACVRIIKVGQVETIGVYEECSICEKGSQKTNK